jgi:Fe-S-cluster formation regulator IscX/YfhJ
MAEERSRRRTGRKQPVTETDEAERGSLDLVAVITDAIEMAEADDDWVDLGTIANNLKKLYPDFDPRTYGNRRLSKLIQGNAEAFRMRRDHDNNSVTVRLAAADTD